MSALGCHQERIELFPKFSDGSPVFQYHLRHSFLHLFWYAIHMSTELREIQARSIFCTGEIGKIKKDGNTPKKTWSCALLLYISVGISVRIIR